VLGGCLYVAGGFEGASSAGVERYDVASDTWEAVAAEMLEGRHLCGVVTTESVGPAEEQDFFDSLVATASRVQV
jgi:hypothetical protein